MVYWLISGDYKIQSLELGTTWRRLTDRSFQVKRVHADYLFHIYCLR
jgi:hypothetical protein